MQTPGQRPEGLRKIEIVTMRCACAAATPRESLKTMPTENAKRTVLIIGAGPGGLTLANALQRKGVACMVFERNLKTLQHDIGAGFSLATGRIWLEQIFGPEKKHRLSKIMTPVNEFRVVEDEETNGESEGKLLGRYNLGSIPKIKKQLNGPLLAGTTRSCLMNVLNDNLHPGTLRLGWECRNITENEDGTLTVRFDVTTTAGGEKETRTEVGAVVVGADGIHSKVRELMFGPRTLGTYNQAVWLLLKRNIPPEVLDFSKEENQACWMLATKKGSGIGIVGYPTSPTDFEMCYAYKLSNEQKNNSTQNGNGRTWQSARYGSAASREEALERMKKCPGVLGKVARLVESPQELIHISLGDASLSLDVDAWHMGRVVIIGDAPHAPTPLAGQGCNSAIGDACVLAKHLHRAFELIDQEQVETNSDKLISEVFLGYEKERKKYGEKVCKQGRHLIRSRIANLAMPQTANSPRNFFEVSARKWLTYLMETLINTFPDTVAHGTIKEIKAGCGKVDFDGGDNDQPHDRHGPRLWTMLGGKGFASRSGN